MDPLFLSVADAARACSLGRSKFYGLISSGAVKTVKVGTRTLVPVSALREFAEGVADSPPTDEGRA